MLVGQWRKDETYYYGRFIGEVTFSEDGGIFLPLEC